MDRVRKLRLVDVDVEITWDDPRLTPVVAGLYTDAPAGNGAGTRLSLRSHRDAFQVVVDGQPMPERCRLDQLFQDVEFAVTDATLTQLRHRYLLIHSAVVVLQRRALLAIGPHDAGKTSLAAALGRAGASLLSDEVAPVEPDDLRVRPFPRDFILHAGTLAAMPDLPPSPEHKRFCGYRYLPPSAVCGRPPGPAARVGGLLFPRRQERGPERLQAVGESEAARRILEQCFDLAGLGANAADAVARLASRPAAELIWADAGAATVLVEDWWSAAASRS